MRFAPACVLVAAALVGCSDKAKHADDLGDINEVVQKLSSRDCRFPHVAALCTKRVRDRECGCYLTVDMKTAKSSPRVSELEFVIGNCMRDEGLKEARALLDGMVPIELFDDLGRVEGPSHKTYGAVSADVTWSPDVFQVGMKQESQITESFHVVVQPKDGKPDTQTKLATPTVTLPPECDPRNEDMASIAAGPVVVRQLSCGEPVTSLPAYTIDKQRVTCDAYKACVAAMACRDAGWKCTASAVATLESATAFCQWRGAKLPSVAELQRAIRGPKGDKYPTGEGWLASEGCKNATARDPRTHEPRRCENVSADGVVYYVMDTEAFEWTRDQDCQNPDAPSSKKPVGQNAFNETLDSAHVRLDSADVAMGTFRCAR